MEHLITFKISQVLHSLRGLDFYITGSLALCLHEKLDREVHDLDIMTQDPRVVAKLRNMGMVLENHTEGHFKFLTYENLHVDVFTLPYEGKVITKNIKGLKLHLVSPESIWINKLQFLGKLLTKHHTGDKYLSDLLYHFNTNYN